MAVAKCAGTVTFSWSCLCDAINYANAQFCVNGAMVEKIGGQSSTSYTKTLHVEVGDKLTWIYTKMSSAYNKGQDCAYLYSMSFVPDTLPTYDVSVVLGEHVSSVTDTIEGRRR